MRVVADTNVIVSAFLWGGVPRLLLDAAEAQRIELFTSRALIAKLEDVLSREKLAEQLKQTRFSAAYLLARYTQLATLITPPAVQIVIAGDDEVGGCGECAGDDGLVVGIAQFRSGDL